MNNLSAISWLERPLHISLMISDSRGDISNLKQKSSKDIPSLDWRIMGEKSALYLIYRGINDPFRKYIRIKTNTKFDYFKASQTLSSEEQHNLLHKSIQI